MELNCGAFEPIKSVATSDPHIYPLAAAGPFQYHNNEKEGEEADKMLLPLDID